MESSLPAFTEGVGHTFSCVLVNRGVDFKIYRLINSAYKEPGTFILPREGQGAVVSLGKLAPRHLEIP